MDNTVRDVLLMLVERLKSVEKQQDEDAIRLLQLELALGSVRSEIRAEMEKHRALAVFEFERRPGHGLQGEYARIVQKLKES